jgi:hypothetical protein
MNAAKLTAGPAPLGRPSVNRAPLVALVVSVAVLAIAGAVLSAGVISRGDTGRDVPVLKGPFGTAQDIPTSFGAIAVDGVEKVNGLTAKSLAGMTHGISNYVAPDKTQVQATVTLTNLLNEQTVDYSPTQFRLLVGDDRKPVKEMRASFRAGTLQPNASISGQVKYVAPRSGSRLWIEFTDPKRPKPILIDLGRTGKTPANAFDGFHKH